jgi:hypothetical protein
MLSFVTGIKMGQTSRSSMREGLRAYSLKALRTAIKPSPYGQPLSDSHPHIMNPGELTPGIPASDYELRRSKLMDSLPDRSVVVAVSAPVKYMSNNIFYKFRQSSNLWYLTGFEEADSALILDLELQGVQNDTFLSWERCGEGEVGWCQNRPWGSYLSLWS